MEKPSIFSQEGAKAFATRVIGTPEKPNWTGIGLLFGGAGLGGAAALTGTFGLGGVGFLGKAAAMILGGLAGLTAAGIITSESTPAGYNPERPMSLPQINIATNEVVNNDIANAISRAHGNNASPPSEYVETLRNRINGTAQEIDRRIAEIQNSSDTNQSTAATQALTWYHNQQNALNNIKVKTAHGDKQIADDWATIDLVKDSTQPSSQLPIGEQIVLLNQHYDKQITKGRKTLANKTGLFKNLVSDARENPISTFIYHATPIPAAYNYLTGNAPWSEMTSAITYLDKGKYDKFHEYAKNTFEITEKSKGGISSRHNTDFQDGVAILAKLDEAVMKKMALKEFTEKFVHNGNLQLQSGGAIYDALHPSPSPSTATSPETSSPPETKPQPASVVPGVPSSAITPAPVFPTAFPDGFDVQDVDSGLLPAQATPDSQPAGKVPGKNGGGSSLPIA